MASVGSAPPAKSGPDTDLTRVDLIWIEGRIEHWIRFGRSAGEQIIDRRRRVVCFRPGAVFAFVRWRSNDYGTIVSRIDIVVPVAAGEALVSLPGVTPGGDILLHLSGWPKVEAALRAIDSVEAIGVDPSDAAPEHWRHVHNRLAVGMIPRPYAWDRHRAWLQRKDLQP
ncbi:MAG: DUF2840 domain-containing protein [Sphingomonas sp.]